MKIEIGLKDAIVFAFIIILAVTMFVRLAKIEAMMQTTALVKAVNDQGAAIQQIVTFLNGKPWIVPPAKGLDLVETPKPK